MKSCSIGDILLVTRIAVIDNLIRDYNASSLQLRHNFEAEVIWRWDPSGPAIICEAFSIQSIIEDQVLSYHQ